MPSPDIIEVDESNFDYQVIAYSQQVPVIVDFWAEWCDSCQRMGVVLERQARDNQGKFRLAKVNVDENLELAKRYQVRTVPAQRVFQDGRLIGQLNGPKSDNQLTGFVKRMVPGPESLLVEKSRSLIQAGKYQQAVDTCQEILEEQPHQAETMLLLIKAYLHTDQPQKAHQLFQRFPPSPFYQRAEKLAPLIKTLVEEDAQTPPPGKIEAVYQRALRLISLDNIPAALDGLLEVLRMNKTYRGGKAKELVLGLFELLGDDHPVTREYRPRLANILF